MPAPSTASPTAATPRRAITLAAALTALFAVPTPAQDECTTAIPVIDGVNGPFSNTAATTSPQGWPCGAVANDVWFQYVATCNGVLTADTCSPTRTLDTVLQALSGSCAALTSLGCSDDACGFGSRVRVTVTLGVTYWFRVGGFGTTRGSFDLTLSCAPGVPRNDECTGAVTVVTGVNGPFTTVGASTSAQPWQCGPGQFDVWFRYVAACTAPTTFHTCTSTRNHDTVLEVYSNACGGPVVGCNNDSCGLGSSVTASLTQGQTYYVRVGGFGGGTGNFDLVIRVGTGNGGFTTVANGCGAMTIAASGSPNLGETFTITLGNVRASPFLRFGLTQLNIPVCPPASCQIGPDNLDARAGSSVTLTTPCDPTLIGLTLGVQGVDLGAPGGCTFVPFTLTDTVVVTLG